MWGTKRKNGFFDRAREVALFRDPEGISISLDNLLRYVPDTGNRRIPNVDISTRRVALLAGNGLPGFIDGNSDKARFNRPIDVALSPEGLFVNVADRDNH